MPCFFLGWKINKFIKMTGPSTFHKTLSFVKLFSKKKKKSEAGFHAVRLLFIHRYEAPSAFGQPWKVKNVYTKIQYTQP